MANPSKHPRIIISQNGFSCYGANREAFFCQEPEYILSGPAETGKTISCLYKIHILCLSFPNVRALLLRKTFSELIESAAQTLINKVIKEGEATIYGGVRPFLIEYPNGSRIVLSGLDKASRVLSSEWDLIYVPQAEELTLAEWEILLTRVTGRAGNLPVPQLFGDCNPSHSTHWIRQRALQGFMPMFVSRHRDNPMLYDPKTGIITEQGERTLAMLNRLSGARKQRLLYGLWVQEEGAIFDAFSEERHKVKSFQPQPAWVRVVGIDPKGAYTAAVWLAYDPENRCLHVYREYYQPFGKSIRDHATAILSASGNEPIMLWCGGSPSERQERLEFRTYGIPLQPPPFGDLWLGIDRVYDLIKNDLLFVHDNCLNLLSEIGSYKRKTIRGIVTDEIENKETYHLLDALRYATAAITQNRTITQFIYDPPIIGVY